MAGAVRSRYQNLSCAPAIPHSACSEDSRAQHVSGLDLRIDGHPAKLKTQIRRVQPSLGVYSTCSPVLTADRVPVPANLLPQSLLCARTHTRASLPPTWTLGPVASFPDDTNEPTIVASMSRATAPIQLSNMSHLSGESQIRQRHPYERFEEEGPPEDEDEGWNTEDERAALLQRNPHPQHVQDRERERLKQNQAELARFRER